MTYLSTGTVVLAMMSNISAINRKGIVSNLKFSAVKETSVH